MAGGASQSQAVVFTTVGCPFCKRVKDLLKAKQISYDDIELSADAELRKEVKAAAGSHTVPQVSLCL